LNRYCIASDHLRAAVAPHGAELCQLQTGAGLDLLWTGDPAVWARQAPNLFPVVGALKGGRLRHQGQSYPMPQHGFARDRQFTLVRLTGHSVTLRLVDDAATRAQYPFRFQLDTEFSIDGAELTVRYALRNPGGSDLLASFGAHPGFRWPLQPGIPREAHWLEFEKPEGELLPGVTADGLLTGRSRPSPVKGRVLALHDGLFTADALIFMPVQSRTVRYSAPGAPVIEFAWDGFEQLGVWTKPGAGFLCLEPWRGFASPEGFDGELADKPGILRVSPGATVTAQYSVKVLPPDID
jgi:galactose mutarotase-like enzyme